jgi:hypothetical protein
VGSEGDFAHLCRDLSVGVYNRPILAFPALNRLRAKRARHIILLTDTTCSGVQGQEYLDWLWRSTTIKSWHSGRLLRFHYISYMCTQDGRRAINSHVSRPSCKMIQACESGDSAWTPQQRKSVKTLCVKYGEKDWELGYAKMMSLQVFSYSCPNNVPSILRYGSRSKGFKGLFGRRPTDMCQYAISGNTENLKAMARWLGITVVSPQALVCYALQFGPARPYWLSARLGLPITSVNEGLNKSLDAGYVRLLSKAYRLTREGKRFARSLLPPVDTSTHKMKIPGSRFDYIPRPWNPVASSSSASIQEDPNE